MPTAPDAVEELVQVALDTYDIDVVGEMTAEELDDARYEVEVPFEGELLIEEVTGNYGGFLLFNKDEYGTLEWKGARDGMLLLTAEPA
jgi:hypothetical protein